MYVTPTPVSAMPRAKKDGMGGFVSLKKKKKKMKKKRKKKKMILKPSSDKGSSQYSIVVGQIKRTLSKIVKAVVVQSQQCLEIKSIQFLYLKI